MADPVIRLFGSPRRLVANLEHRGALEITDDGTEITVTLRDGGTGWAWMLRRQPHLNRLYLQDIRRHNGLWNHRRGVGSLLMNTGIQYLQQLGEPELQSLHGFLVADVQDPLLNQEHRVRFFHRFGVQVHLPDFIFSTPIHELRLNETEGLGLSGYPIFVPLSHFKADLE